ncbi:YBR191Wp-like protein, partial [Lyophyllum atratum]
MEVEGFRSNVTPAAVGVIMYKVVGYRYIEQRINLRAEHARHSKCRQRFLDHPKSSHDADVATKMKDECVNLRRVLLQPWEAHTVSTDNNAPQTMVPVPIET